MSRSGNAQRKKICIACGGSAGHIFPGLTLAKELLRRYDEKIEISLLTSRGRLAQSLLGKSGFNFRALSVRGLKRGAIWENLDFTKNLIKGTFESMKAILSYRPDCFVGFGSYISGPPFLVASLLRIPTLIHEQNSVPGRANKIMSPFATKVALGFPENAGHRKNTVFTGNPIKKSSAIVHAKMDAVDSLGLDRNKFTILILGGSQGSRSLNSLTISAFKNVKARLKHKVQIIHISGESDYERVKKAYMKAGILNRVYTFFDDMGVIYSAADISISRAGASVVCELAIHRLPCILIPYPFAGGHQLKNAMFFARRNAAVVIEEHQFSQETFIREIGKFAENSEIRESMAGNIGKLAVFDADKKLADEVGTLLWRR